MFCTSARAWLALFCAVFLAGLAGAAAQATPAAFTGIYAQNFDQALTNYAATLPTGFRALTLAGGNSTYTAANPITAAAIASATPTAAQTLISWNFGDAVTDSGASLFNIGSMGNLNDRALGSDPTGVGAMVIELSLTNATGNALTGVAFSYDLKVLTNGSAGTEAGELPGYAFFYSVTGGATAAEWTAVPALSLTNYSEGTTMSSGTVNLLLPAPLGTNGILYFRWADDNNEASSPDQMLAIDNIAVTLLNAAPPNPAVVVAPAPNATGVTNHPVLTVTVSDSTTNALSATFYGRLAGVGNFAVLGTVSGLSSGSNAACAWYGIATNATYEWFVVVSDGALTTSNAVSQFTTTAYFPAIPPTIRLTNPGKSITLAAPANIALTVNAADADGIVTNVAYYQGATKLADVASSPFSYNWTGVGAGTYALTAVATDDDGLTTTSSVVTVTLTNSPALQILQQIKTVFVIAMENHNFTQPNPTSTPQQILGNPAAPYLNSLITAGNSNAAQVSYATHYFCSGIGVHPSEPNYIWAEAGTDFGVETDSVPSATVGNVFDAPHLTRQLNSAGIAWKNYEEDLEFGGSPLNNITGSSPTAINPYYGGSQFAYAPKHNPMSFFTDTQNQNVYPLTNLFADLAANTAGNYNWITPNLFNDQHTGLSGGFVYHGVGYVDDQAGVAQGDNFLATLIPIIMASPAYQSNGVIIIRWDETEGGDSAAYTIPEIIISRFAKGNAYASSVELNHSSDVKTMEEIFGLPFLTNAIPGNELKASGIGYNNVASVNDLSDLFQLITVEQPVSIPTNNVPTNGVTTNIVTQPSAPAHPMNGQMLPGSGGFKLKFSGTAGYGYRVLAATNLNAPPAAWTVVGSGIFNGTNDLFSDLEAFNFPSRFYIIKSP